MPEITLESVCCTCLSVARKFKKLRRVDNGVNNLFFLLSYNFDAYEALSSRRCINRHVRQTHQGIRENARDKICQTCGKAFRYKKCLREHEWIHSGEHPFSCAKCGRTFRQQVSLYTHRRRVRERATRQRDT